MGGFFGSLAGLWPANPDSGLQSWNAIEGLAGDEDTLKDARRELD